MAVRPFNPFNTQCNGKVGYESYQRAHSSMRRFLRRNAPNFERYEGMELGVYRCIYCGRYHIGHQQKRSKQRVFHGRMPADDRALPDDSAEALDDPD